MHSVDVSVGRGGVRGAGPGVETHRRHSLVVKALLSPVGHGAGASEVRLAPHRGRRLVRDRNVDRRHRAGHSVGRVIRRLDYRMLITRYKNVPRDQF